MASFFEKLIGVQDENEQTPEKKSSPITSSHKEGKTPAKKILKTKPAIKTEKKSDLSPEPEPKPKEIKPQVKVQLTPEREMPKQEEAKNYPAEEKIVHYKEPEPAPQSKDEGQLAIDVYQTDDYIVVQSAVGGIKPANLEVTIENGIVQIKGNRQKTETVEQNDYIISECYWGNFSRQFVLPAEVDASRAEALLKDGIITIKIPKINKEKVMKLEIK